ncbi:MAG: tRNA (N(6)-L-threonylcarbamoyladenosine(37)-C(2))-methylthiotransferase MtaB [Clostridia bacterium]|nr:tRNA (N(6)-L-threonylcarbamoyladenosine(37)-C(2))-methylthiotransferase MtaB [Clostridia bacterium]
MNTKKIVVFTLGCKVNQYDSDAILNILSAGGFDVSDEMEVADIYIINTCAVTAEAERKSRQTVTKILKLNPDAEIYVCGCASQRDKIQFDREGVRYVSGTDGKIALAKELVEKVQNDVDMPECSFEIGKEFEENDGVLSFRTRHYIKVQDGCNNFCSYCIIPYLRGRSRSRDLEGIRAELDKAETVAKEIVLTGINLSAYGKEKDSSLADLLRAVKDYPVRMRLGSLEVGVIDRDLLDATKEMYDFCPHFHLSLQSGDDETLKKMNRHYTTAEYESAVKLIREYYPNAAITTDIIVGFPTETEEQFVASMNFAKRIGFSDIHCFPYSSRKGTVAGKWQVLSKAVLTDRAKRMGEVKNLLIKDYLTAQIGKPLKVLFETSDENGVWCGHTENYVKVYSKNGEKNTLKTIVPTRLYLDGLGE